MHAKVANFSHGNLMMTMSNPDPGFDEFDVPPKFNRKGGKSLIAVLAIVLLVALSITMLTSPLRVLGQSASNAKHISVVTALPDAQTSPKPLPPIKDKRLNDEQRQQLRQQVIEASLTEKPKGKAYPATPKRQY
jgi:hypothetical protein